MKLVEGIEGTSRQSAGETTGVRTGLTAKAGSEPSVPSTSEAFAEMLVERVEMWRRIAERRRRSLSEARRSRDDWKRRYFDLRRQQSALERTVLDLAREP